MRFATCIAGIALLAASCGSKSNNNEPGAKKDDKPAASGSEIGRASCRERV